MTYVVLRVINTLKRNISLEKCIISNKERGVFPKQFRIFEAVSIDEVVPVAEEHIAVLNRLEGEATLPSTYSRDNMPMSTIFHDTALISVCYTNVVIREVLGLKQFYVEKIALYRVLIVNSKSLQTTFPGSPTHSIAQLRRSLGMLIKAQLGSWSFCP